MAGWVKAPSRMNAARMRIFAAPLLVAALAAVLLTSQGTLVATSPGQDTLRIRGQQAMGQVVTHLPDGPPPPLSHAPIVSFTPAAFGAVLLPLSNFVCKNNHDAVFQICEFMEMLVHQGELLYIVADEAAATKLQLPNPSLYEYANMPTFDFNIHDTLRVLTVEDLRARLAAVVEGAGTGELLVAKFALSIMQRTRAYTNWFWALNGAGNTYHRLCKYYGTCTREQVQAAAILQPVGSRRKKGAGLSIGLPNHVWESVQELMSCFGPTISVSQPYGKRVDMETDNRVVHLQRVLVGIGDDVCEPSSAKGPGEVIRYKPPNVTMGLRRVQYLRQCAGLPASPPPMTRPSVLLINRPYSDGRHIIGLDEVYSQVRRELPPEVDVRLYLPRVESLAAQAAMFASANILVVPHGASNANFNFLPHDAVILAVYALLGRHYLDKSHANALPSPPYNITVLSVDCKNLTEPRTAALAEQHDFKALSAAQKVYFLSEGAMDKEKATKLAKVLGFSTKDWMDYAAYRPNPSALVAQVLQAVKLWESKVAARQEAAQLLSGTMGEDSDQS